MRRWIAISLVVTLLAPAAFAQDGAQQPTVDVEFKETEAAPGQFLTLRLTILVPTWLPKPVEFPSLEAPNIRVMLPEKSTTAISKPVGGETWSGVSRRYLIAPLIPGDFTIPPQDIIVTYAEPGGDPATVTLNTEAIAFTGVVPEGAEGLDPFIAAEKLTLEQKLDGEPAGMKPGDSVKRIVTARIEGASPMALPQLISAADLTGIASYPDEPILNETDDRGVLAGTREETVTLMAQSGGSGHAPDIEIRWFDLKSKTVETATVDGFDFSIDGPSAISQVDVSKLDYRLIAALAAGVIGIASLIRWAAPRARRLLAARKEARLASEGWAFDALRGAIRRRSLPEVNAALYEWAARVSGPDPRAAPELRDALARIGEGLYGRNPKTPPTTLWAALETAVKGARAGEIGAPAGHAALPTLNPSHRRVAQSA